MRINKWDVIMYDPEPGAIGTEQKGRRPAIVVSPNHMGHYLDHITIIPMTTNMTAYPFRTSLTIGGRETMLMPDQIRTIDLSRVIKQVGTLDLQQQAKVALAINYYFTAQ